MRAEASRHKCLVYDGQPSEQLPVVVPLLLDGLNDNWRCLYLGSPEALEMVDAALATKGVDTRQQTRRGALLLSSDRSHLAGGVFDPKAMVDGLCTAIDLAVNDGFGGLCATGDMRWELGADENFDRLLEYEALLEQVFREKPLRGVCQYHRGMVPERAVHDALVTHRSAYIGDALNEDNLFYVPPEVLLDARDGSKHGEWMCQQILRVLSAERVRDDVLAALRRSEAEQRRLAEQLAAANVDLERRVADRTAQLEVANRHLRAFSYSVSHDLRAPLRAIEGFGDALAQDCGDRLNGDAHRYLGHILSGTRKMGELIEGMLSLGRAVEVELYRVDVDLTALAAEVALDLRKAEPTRVVEMVIHSGMRTPADAALARSILTNLIANAWKFTSKTAGARIEVGHRRGDRGEAVFFVADNGAGFDARYAKKLFGAFQRLHRQDEFPGTGVGLATVERIVSRHGGRIWAEGELGKGATFSFTLQPTAGDALDFALRDEDGN